MRDKDPFARIATWDLTPCSADAACIDRAISCAVPVCDAYSTVTAGCAAFDAFCAWARCALKIYANCW